MSALQEIPKDIRIRFHQALFSVLRWVSRGSWKRGCLNHGLREFGVQVLILDGSTPDRALTDEPSGSRVGERSGGERAIRVEQEGQFVLPR